MCRFLHARKFSVHLGKCLDAQLLDLMVKTMFSFVRHHQPVFQSGCSNSEGAIGKILNEVPAFWSGRKMPLVPGVSLILECGK